MLELNLERRGFTGWDDSSCYFSVVVSWGAGQSARLILGRPWGPVVLVKHDWAVAQLCARKIR